jgi:hypothetical protein
MGKRSFEGAPLTARNCLVQALEVARRGQRCMMPEPSVPI